MPPPSSEPQPLTIPHTPTTPLSPSLRSELLTTLTSHPLPSKTLSTTKSRNKTAGKDFLPSLLSTLDSACEKESWQTKVGQRVREMLERGDATSYHQLLEMIVSEALPNDEEEEIHSQQPIQKAGERGEEAGDNNGEVGKVDIKIPKTAMKAGTKIVVSSLEAAVERGDVQIEDVGGEEREWRDWR